MYDKSLQDVPQDKQTGERGGGITWGHRVKIHLWGSEVYPYSFEVGVYCAIFRLSVGRSKSRNNPFPTLGERLRLSWFSCSLTVL